MLARAQARVCPSRMRGGAGRCKRRRRRARACVRVRVCCETRRGVEEGSQRNLCLSLGSFAPPHPLSSLSSTHPTLMTAKPRSNAQPPLRPGSAGDAGEAPVAAVLARRARNAAKRLKRVEEIEAAAAGGKELNEDQVRREGEGGRACARV